MNLGRAWSQELFRASAAALLGPGAVLAALVVLAWGGGFGAIGSLGEAFTGPSLPSFTNSARPMVGGGRGHRPSAVLVALAATAHASVPAGPSSTGAGAGGTGAGARGGTTGPGSGSSHQGGGSGGGSGGHGTPGGPGSPGSPGLPGSPPPSPPPHPPTVVDTVVSLGTSVTERVPGPVGSLATQTLRSLGQTLDGILSPHASGSRTAVAGLRLP